MKHFSKKSCPPSCSLLLALASSHTSTLTET
ncbi:hypothetical protein E2C01_091229 [Portunus trituberculatus]|uniref:Uncharacterized protein n=1 Tax=Portunus trituberculatus TaxID=210409 RepID=A0A5B7JNU3_PORTR|nr:hypothetical protein [Portunus trituberculatus]